MKPRGRALTCETVAGAEAGSQIVAMGIEPPSIAHNGSALPDPRRVRPPPCFLCSFVPMNIGTNETH
jgi:hypothetical protein